MARARALSESLDIECITGEGDVRQVATERRRGLEETARGMRYQFLGFVAGRENASCIATGHTADDQAETVLMRVIRGSGIRGIRGMLPESPLPGAPSHRLVRPFLVLSREETRALCAEAGIDPILDPSNDDPAFTRNRVRASTLASLEEVNPAVRRALVGLAESARELFAPIEHQAMVTQPRERGPLGAIFPAATLDALPLEALGLVLEREASVFHAEAELNRTRLRNLENVLRKGNGAVQFGPAHIEVSCGLVRVGPPLEPATSFDAVLLSVPGVTLAGPYAVEVATEPLPPKDGAWTGSFDGSFASGALRARPLQPGDRVAGPAGTRAVQDLLVNAKVPRWERPGIIAIADSTAVLALAGSSQVLTPEPAPGSALYLRLTRRTT